MLFDRDRWAVTDPLALTAGLPDTTHDQLCNIPDISALLVSCAENLTTSVAIARSKLLWQHFTSTMRVTNKLPRDPPEMTQEYARR